MPFYLKPPHYVTAVQGENMTDVLTRFIEDYVAKNGVEPKKKARR